MSQQPSTVINGPAGDTNQSPQNTVKAYTTTYDPQRPPPLARLDSTSNLSPRLGYPNQQGAQFRPPQPRPQFTGSPQYGARPPLQRNPSSGQFNIQQNQGTRQVSPNPAAGLRPVTPYPRAQQSPSSPRSPTNLYQQKTFPAGSPQFNKEQTLDTTPDLTQNKNASEYSIQSSNIIEEEEPLSLTNVNTEKNFENEDEKYISSNQVEDEKNDEDKPPRPESRNQKVYEEEIINRKSAAPSVENIIAQEAKIIKPDSLNINTSGITEKISLNDDKKKVERKSPSPEPPKSPRNHKMTLNFEEQTRSRSPRLQSGKSEERSPTTPGRKIAAEKPKTLKPETKNGVRRNFLTKSPSKSEGDNDSGVDESTQGNDQSSNGDHNSPRKSSGKNTARTTSPPKTRSLSRGSKSPNLKTPDSPTPSIPTGNDKKKVPMNKVHVGGAPSPNLKEVKSKIGSLQNTSYRPGGGNIKIEHKKIDISKAQSRIAAKNDAYIPGGGEKKIEHRKLQWNASSKIGSLDNTTHKPKGGDKKIETIKLDFKDKAKPKVGSKDNIKYQPGGGDVKIENKKIDIKAKSKVGSLDNMKHKPGGGDRKIFDDKEYLRQKSGLSGENNSLNGSQPSTPLTEHYSPEVNLISPTQDRVRLLETITTESPRSQSRPSSRLMRTSSLRSSKKQCSPRIPWRM